jgi:uncharacterized protein (DUF4415 family)
MSGEAEEKIVRHRMQPLTPEQIERLKKVADLPDEEIDFSDIPQAGDDFFQKAKRGAMYRLVKQQLTIRLDADVLDWFKRHARNGKGYQTDINRVLREYVEAQEKKAG